VRRLTDLIIKDCGGTMRLIPLAILSITLASPATGLSQADDEQTAIAATALQALRTNSYAGQRASISASRDSVLDKAVGARVGLSVLARDPVALVRFRFQRISTQLGRATVEIEAFVRSNAGGKARLETTVISLTRVGRTWRVEKIEKIEVS
jgi:hypothetical protein